MLVHDARHTGGSAETQLCDDHAFHKLVLPEEKKVLIRSLVENSANFSDIISGKGGGCIFLLHGSPGVGKTLTAESVAELLGRQIRTIIRLALALAKTKGVPVNKTHLNRTIKVALQFTANFK